MVFGQSIGKASRENLSNLIGKLKAGSETKNKSEKQYFCEAYCNRKAKVVGAGKWGRVICN